jgi:hypothetical protein
VKSEKNVSKTIDGHTCISETCDPDPLQDPNVPGFRNLVQNIFFFKGYFFNFVNNTSLTKIDDTSLAKENNELFVCHIFKSIDVILVIGKWQSKFLNLET